MLPFLVSVPIAIGCVVAGGIIVGKSLPEPTRRRLCKETVKTILKGARAVGSQCPALMEDIEDAIAESRHEEELSHRPEKDNGPGEGQGVS